VGSNPSAKLFYGMWFSETPQEVMDYCKLHKLGRNNDYFVTDHLHGIDPELDFPTRKRLREDRNVACSWIGYEAEEFVISGVMLLRYDWGTSKIDLRFPESGDVDAEIREAAMKLGIPDWKDREISWFLHANYS